jgi:hypothetical protein
MAFSCGRRRILFLKIFFGEVFWKDIKIAQKSMPISKVPAFMPIPSTTLVVRFF